MHEAVADGEVEDDLAGAEMEPGGAWPLADEDRQRGLGAAVEERRHLVAPLDLLRCADQDRGIVGGHGDVGGEHSQQPVEVAVLCSGHEGVDHLPVGQAVLDGRAG